MFSAKEFNKPTGGVKIPVGIHEGVTFGGVIKEKTWMDITFYNNDGRSIHTRLFEPSGNRPKEGETVAEALQREQERNARTLTDVMYAVMDAEAVDAFTAPTYQAYQDGALFYLAQKKGALVNIKVVPDYKEKMYPELPSYGFVEAHVPGQPSKLMMSKKDQAAIELMLKRREDENTKSSTPEDSSDLPF